MVKKIILTAVCLMLFTRIYAGEKIKIVASIIPLYNITKAIAGDRADIICMVPPGMSPHAFSPKPSQLKSMADADIFIQAGAGLEFWADKMIQAAGNKKLRIIRITDGVKLIAGDADERSGNPHIWLDPVLVKIFSVKILEALTLLSPVDGKYFKKNYDKFSHELDSLDRYIASETKKFRIKQLVSFHPAWVYFESRYGLKEIAVIEAVPGREPSPKELGGIIEQVKRTGIKTIFAEAYLSRKAADVIAGEAGVKVLILNPEGGAGEDYITFMKKNFEVMREAME